MSKEGKSVLLFLSGWMGVTQIVITKLVTPGKGVEIGYNSILLFSFLSLLIIITALVLMFYKDPAFLLAQREDVIPIILLRQLEGVNDPGLIKLIIKNFISNPASEEVNEVDEEGMADPESRTIPDESIDEEGTTDESESTELNNVLNRLIN